MLLELKNIKKYFPVKKGFLGSSKLFVKAVDGINFDIKEGENVSLVGESGSGKSTLAKLILKLYPLSEGKIFFDGADITWASHKKMRTYRKNMQMVFQDPYSSLDPRFSVRRIMMEPMSLQKWKNDSEKELRMLDMLNAVGLREDILGRYPHEFSGGERQRIAIARALIMNPKLLILDEAVSSLDVIIQQQIVDLLVELQKRFSLTYLFISHNLRTVKKISRRIAVMYKGKIVEVGKTEDIFHHPCHPYTKKLLKAAIEYRFNNADEDIQIHPQAEMISCGEDHFILESK